MSSIRAGLGMHSEGAANSGKAYVSTGAFNNAFYTYTAYMDTSLVRRGQFSLVTTLASACPAGRVLALSGRKLTPGVNPMDYFSSTSILANTVANGGPGVKFMLGVIDLVTGLRGFIDPTNRLFANYDSNRPVTDYIADANTMNLGITVNSAAIASGQGANVNTVATTIEPILQTTSLTTAVNVGGAVAGRIQMFSVIPTTPTSFVVNTTAVTTNSVILLTPSYSPIDPLHVTQIAASGVFNVTNTGGLIIGQPIVITGTNTGTGSITGYTSGTTYYIIAIVANTSFTLSATSGGGAVTTVAGTAAGLEYSRSTTANPILPVTGNAGTVGVFGIANTSGLAVGQAVVITGTFSNTHNITVPPYVSGTTYYIITIVANTSFTLSATLGGSAVTTVAGTGAPGVTFTLQSSVSPAVVPIAAVGAITPGSSFAVTVATGTATTYVPVINFLIVN